MDATRPLRSFVESPTSTYSTLSAPAPSRKKEWSVNDAFVAVMGVTGAGKSTFISQLTGDSNVVIGHGLQSSTSVRVRDLMKLNMSSSDAGRVSTRVYGSWRSQAVVD